MFKNVFLFSGLGSHYYRMGEELYRGDKRFRARMDELDRIPRELLGRSIVDVLYHEDRKKSEAFTRSLYSHPALFMVEYSLARLLMEAGIVPDCLFGASLGECVALAVAEALPAEDFLANLILKARVLEEKCAPGGMIGVIESPSLYEEVPLIRENSTLVGANSGEHFVISGSREGILKIQAWLKANGKLFQMLPVSYGFHSPNIDPLRDLYLDSSRSLSIKALRWPVISCLTGGLLDIAGVDADYFWKVAREPIRFPEALETLKREQAEECRLVDLGPAATFAGFIRQQNGLGKSARIFTILSPFGNELRNWEKLQNAMRTVPTDKTAPAARKRAFLFPGQGSQSPGMGKDLFDRYREHTETADAVLGYSIRELCLENAGNRLNRTQYTQPALFVVNALSYLNALETGQAPPDYVAGHSLGEYNALFAAGVIDFSAGLKLVRKRGELMAAADNGGMAAVIGLGEKAIRGVLERAGLQQIEIANINSPGQIVISGPRSEIESAQSLFEKSKARYIILNVSGAFHSRLMEKAGAAFREYLGQFAFSPPKIPVLSNVLARPYPAGEIRELLALQMIRPVKWMESVRWMWGQGVEEFIEIGPGRVLTGLVKSIQKDSMPLSSEEMKAPKPPSTPEPAAEPVFLPEKSAAQEIPGGSVRFSASSLGCREFRKRYGLKYAYATGGMAHGIASAELVIRMGRAGMLGFFGAGLLPPDRVEAAIRQIQSGLGRGEAYGLNVRPGPREAEQIDLCLKYGVPCIEAAGYVQITPALVKYRLSGLSRRPDGSVAVARRIMAKLSRPEVALDFLSPAPDAVVEKLLGEGAVTPEQAELARTLPMADDLCVEADSAGLTDGGALSSLLPAVARLRDSLAARHWYPEKIGVGAAGGIGTPEAAAAAFVLGADFILTGSINQCTVEAATSPAVKEMLQDMNVQDTAYAPAGESFELGSRIQVLKKGVFFPARANKLYDLYRRYDSLEALDEKTREQLEKRYFRRSFDAVFEACREIFPEAEIRRAEASPRHRMATVFRWYFHHSAALALAGDEADKVNFQIHCGPALGAFNQSVKGTELENWKNRHADDIARRLLTATADVLTARVRAMLEREDGA